MKIVIKRLMIEPKIRVQTTAYLLQQEQIIIFFCKV